MLTFFSADAAKFFKPLEHLRIFKQILIVIFSQEITYSSNQVSLANFTGFLLQFG